MSSEHYKTFSNIVDVRIVKGESLVAMKLESAREYKNDYSDIIGILKEHYEIGEKLSIDKIKSAYELLYGSWNNLNKKSKDFINDVLKDEKYLEMYSKIRTDEISNKQLLKNFNQDYPKVLNSDNVSNILNTLKNR